MGRERWVLRDRLLSGWYRFERTDEVTRYPQFYVVDPAEFWGWS